MVKYENGKIYKIESNIGDMVYYGSTTKSYLSQRMDTHRASYKTWLKGKCSHVRVYDLFEAYGIENCQIVLIESCPCESKDELTAREAHYIKTKDCVNKNIPGRTLKEWREANVEHLKKYKQEYHETNAEHIKEHLKEWREANKEKSKEYNKKYREANKEKEKIKYNCECGSSCRIFEKARHERTKKHQDFLKKEI